MASILEIHPDSPQARRVREAAECVRDGGLIAWPTDSCYAFGWHMGDSQMIKRIQRLRKADSRHNFTMVCRDLSEIAVYAKVENWAYRMLKGHTPGAYTFILRATRDVPRRLQNPKRRTIGIRVPDHAVAQALLAELGEPMMSSTLLLPGDDLALNDPWEINERLGNELDLVIDAGACGIEPTTVVDMTSDFPEVLRAGKGPVEHFA